MSNVANQSFSTIFRAGSANIGIKPYYKLWYVNSVREAWLRNIDKKLISFKQH